MVELMGVRRTDAYAAELSLTGTLGHTLWGPLSCTLELAETVPLDQVEDASLQFNTGLALQISNDLSVDGAVQTGVNDAADDRVVFVCAAARY
jgi:hypothetical protein